MQSQVTPSFSFEGQFRYMSHSPIMTWIIQAAVLFALPVPWDASGAGGWKHGALEKDSWYVVELVHYLKVDPGGY